MRRLEEIGKRIQLAREQSGMTLLQFAKKTGLNSTVYLSDIERGLRIPLNEEHCQKIAEVLGIEPVSYEEYQTAAAEDSISFFEENRATIIAQVNTDLGCNLPADATKEMVDAAFGFSNIRPID